jgi:hypothetical protein
MARRQSCCPACGLAVSRFALYVEFRKLLFPGNGLSLPYSYSTQRKRWEYLPAGVRWVMPPDDSYLPIPRKFYCFLDKSKFELVYQEDRRPRVPKKRGK